MEMRADKAETGPIVTGFRGANLIVDGLLCEGAVLLTPTSLHPWPVAEGWDGDLCALVASAVAGFTPELLVLGTGRALVRPPYAAVAALEADGVGLEVVDSRTAARVWNILRAEGRQVVAAILPLDV